MKLGIIGSPEGKTLVHAKELGLDFVEFDLNPSDFWGKPLDETTPKPGEIQAAMQATGDEDGAAGRWARSLVRSCLLSCAIGSAPKQNFSVPSPVWAAGHSIVQKCGTKRPADQAR